MNLQQVKPNRHSGWQIICCECCKLKDEAEMFGDLDRPWHYVCHECATTYKGVDDETVQAKR